jgi:hypothetical protein
MSLTNYIKQKKNKSQRFSNIEINQVDPLPDNISIRSVIARLGKVLPSHLLSTIKAINIGQFEELKKREIQAYYKDSSVYMTNQQVDEEDMMDDIVHEIAHAVEEVYKNRIYSGGELQKEFVRKRLQLWGMLKNKGFEEDMQPFLNIDYSKEFDEYLYDSVGYSTMRLLTPGIFYSPYAATSIREYFANGFEAFYLRGSAHKLKDMSPVLYKKLGSLLEDEDRT